jgi:effector-binding domain-containing protein
MKILKYILLLLILILIASTVFVATLKPDFDVVRTKIIKAPKSTIFNYVNEYKNWSDFGSWKQDDPSMTFVYPAITSGKGSSYSWNGKDGNGKMTTIYTKQYDSISQKMVFEGSESQVFWSFKDTLGKTKVTWRNKGRMDFPTKIFSAFLGGIDNLVGAMYERSLVNLDKNLDYEINTFSVNVNGYLQKSGGFYLKKTIVSKDSDVAKNIQIMIPNLVNFSSKNKIIAVGKPFVIYNSFDNAKQTTNFSVCTFIKEEIFTSQESEYVAGNFLPFQAVKTTLTGDYSHIAAAKSKTLAFVTKNNLEENFTNPYIEVYSKTKTDIKRPSKWITEIYIPVNSKTTVVKVFKPKALTPKTVVQPNSTSTSQP